MKVSYAMSVMEQLLGIRFTATQLHIFRRGTTSCLECLELRTFVLNLHLGWSTKSNMLNMYMRKVALADFDKLFYSDILRCNF